MLPDQGLRYELAGVVAAHEVLALMSRACGDAAVARLDAGGLGLLPVTAELADAATPAALCALGLTELPGGTADAAHRRNGLLTGPESGFHVLTPGLAALVEACSTVGPTAYLEADYLGLEGVQTAAVWRAGALVLGPLLLGRREEFSTATAPISVALRALGVEARGRRDEFVLVGLGRHRRTVDWIEAQRRTGPGSNTLHDRT
jgi:hypothetical protein